MSDGLAKKYWYQITIHECPVCGRYSEDRERKYGVKPENPYIFEDIYDYCDTGVA